MTQPFQKSSRSDDDGRGFMARARQHCDPGHFGILDQNLFDHPLLHRQSVLALDNTPQARRVAI
ncbi:MAG: hypothetical protein ACD_62C00231G0001, partial [uncultured bacterium]